METEKHYDNLRADKSSTCIKCSAEARRVIAKEDEWLVKRFYAARSRCENTNDQYYHAYGARGIRFNFTSHLEFIAYVKSLPNFSRSLEIDRIDNNGNYEIGNLQWSSRYEQSRNRQRSIYVTYKDETMVLKDFIEKYTNLSSSYALRLYHKGHTLEELVHWKEAKPTG